MGSENGDIHQGERVEVALVGTGIERSLSPALHEREGALLGFDYEYRLIDLPAVAPIGEVVERCRWDGLRGLNVTHPFKQLVLDALDRLSPEAAALGAVNTVVFGPHGAEGHNTDTTGFRDAFAAGLPGAAIDRVVVVGAGGAGAAVAYALLGLDAGQVRVVDRDRERAAELVAKLDEHFGAGRAVAADSVALDDADGVVHATPTGMGGGSRSAIDPAWLHPRLWVAEVVYVPLDTQLLRDAREAGCTTLDGGGMVAAQAAGSLELFTGAAPDRERMTAHMAELVAGQREAAR
ncbi:MAG TPA: shikimate dehydrogenase [Thermoleophilaceae bacterium]|nr:shikimate dehydrogenase [Thermoleophilaceae bacterium]